MGIVIGTKPDIPENIQPYRAVLLKQLSLAKNSALIRCDVVHDRLLVLFKRATRGCPLLAKPPDGVYTYETSESIHLNTNVQRIGQEDTLSKPNFDKIARSMAMLLQLRSRDMEGCQNIKSRSRDLFSTPLT